MEVIEAIHSRRSIRAYTAQPIPQDLIGALIWDAAQAPPPFAGEAPWTFVVLQGAERIAGYSIRAKQFAKDSRPAAAGWTWTERDDFRVFWNAPVVVIICGPAEDCCRAGQLLILSAHARGLGTCWVGAPMPWLRTSAAKEEIGKPSDLTPASAICVGYGASLPEARKRPQPAVIWSA